MKIGLRYKGKKIFLDVERNNGMIGLMFSGKENAKALLFNFHKNTNPALHSFFVFFPFLAIWLDGKNKISEMRIINPFSARILPKKSFYKVVEIPFNRRYKKIIQKLVGKRKI